MGGLEGPNDDNPEEEFPGVVIACRLACDLFLEWVLHLGQKTKLTKAAPLDSLDSCCTAANDGLGMLRRLHSVDHARVAASHFRQTRALGALASLRRQMQKAQHCRSAIHTRGSLQSEDTGQGPVYFGFDQRPEHVTRCHRRNGRSPRRNQFVKPDT